MDRQPSLPPIYRAVAVAGDADPLAEAARRAAGGAEPATLLYAERPDRLDCALVLAPEQPLREALKVAYVLMLGINDALGATIPPQIAITFGWPDRILVNQALGGGLAIRSPGDDPEQVPEWMAARLVVDILGEATERDAETLKRRTTLFDEGCDLIGPGDLLESFARHFLSWMNRWQDAGFDPVRTAWTGRAEGIGEDVSLDHPGGTATGRITEIDESGSLVLTDRDTTHRVPLTWLLAGSSWSL